MKHYLLSLMALTTAMFTSASAWAQTELPDPVRPTFPEVEGNWVTPEAGGTYYIYNVKAGQFLGTGRDYGTRAITTNEKLVKLTDASAWAVDANKNAIIPFQVQEVNGEADAEGTWFYLQRQKCSGGAGSYLAHDGKNAWADFSEGSRDNNKNGYWRFDKQEDGSYMLKPHDIVTLTDEEGTPILDGEGLEQLVLTSLYYGVDGGNMDIKASYTWSDLTVSDTHFTTWRFLDASQPEDVEAILNNTEARNQFNTAFAIYNAKLALKATIAQAEEAEIDATEVTKAITIYNNAEATLEQVQKQNNHLQAEMAGLKYKDISEFNIATDDNPQDVTEYVLINPDFEKDYAAWKSYTEVDGWDITIAAQNRNLQETAGTTNEELGYVKIDHFLEAWNGSALGDGTISQTIYGLPAGKYVLECDAFTGQGTKTFEGIYIFIQSDNGIEKKRMNTPDGQPMHFTVTYLNEGSDFLTFGLMAESTNANWIGCDNFKLTFYGATTKTQAQLDLEAAVKEVETFYDELDYLFCNKDVKSAFETAFTTASDLVSDGGSDVDCLAAKQALEEKTAAVNSSVEAYKVLLSYLDITGGKALLDKYYNIADDCGMTELTTKWGDWKDNWEQAYDAGTMTDEEIYEKTASIYPELKAAWLNVNVEDVKVGTDLTWLIENADFEEGGVYTAGSGGSIPGWTIVSGDITRKDHVIEAYHRLLDFQQVIPNMPAGVYDVTLQGFVRHDDPEQNDNKSTIFYGGDSKATLMQRSDQWHATGFYLSDSQGDPCGGANKDQDITNSHGEAVKVPNGMSGFYFWEDEENTGGETMDYANWKPGDKYYTNHIKVILKADGDLTIGLKSLDTHDWIIWDNFGLSYLGQDANIYDEMIQDKVKELDKVCDPDKIIITSGGQQLVEDLKAEIETKKGTLNADTEAEYEDKIDALINYLNEGHKLAISLRDDLSDYNDIRLANPDLTSPDENGFASWVSGIIGLFPYEDYGMLPAEDDIKDDAYKGTINNNEALQATTIDMNRRMADYVMQFAAANPLQEDNGTLYGNATEAIFNPRYTKYADENQTTRGWTMEVADSIKGKVIGLGNSYAEVFDCSNFVVSQTVRGLYPGWYLLTVDGFYRPGLPKEEDTKKVFTTEDAQKQYVEMFAESGDLKYSHPLMNIMANAQIMSIVGGDTKVTIGEEELYIPDNMASAATYLQQEVGHLVGEQEVYYQIAVLPEFGTFSYNSVYRNGMLVQVDESGEMTIGLRKEDLWVYHDWTFFGNWTLTYFGDEENIPTAVETVEAKSAKNMIQDIFTIDGRQAQRLQRGINIVRTSDGKIHKVLVK